jgi:DNA-binding GntR family transcriptional regulator
MPANNKVAANAAEQLTSQVYRRIKDDIFNFVLLPGDRFSENEMAARCGVSRTPVREALYRLEREGYLQVAFRSGWHVRPLDFALFDQLYDLRTVLEVAAVERLCASADLPEDLQGLRAVWDVPKSKRLADGQLVCELDEAFHQGLVVATGNLEMARVHREITEKIRIVRRLDFTDETRVAITYDEHRDILRLLLKREASQCADRLKTHIAASRDEVHKLTLHKLYEARRPR